MSEGRKAFANRLAGIESGAECDRLAPQLSALADGEARAEDMALLRPHLRTCLVCRARLRDYPAAPARVAAIAPPVAAAGLLAAARDLVAAVAVRWHHAVELAAGHKFAAVVASTAALAGGGAATVATVDAGDGPAAARPAAGNSDVPSGPVLSGNEGAELRNTPRSSGGAPGQHETAPANRDPAPTARPAGESSSPAPGAGEFTPDPAPTEPTATRPGQHALAAGQEPEDGAEFAP